MWGFIEQAQSIVGDDSGGAVSASPSTHEVEFTPPSDRNQKRTKHDVSGSERTR